MEVGLGSFAANLVASGTWMNGGELHRLRRRLRMPRKRSGKACVYCRRIKQKCDENRPCQRCIKKGASAAEACCREEDSGGEVLSQEAELDAEPESPVLQAVERPLSTALTVAVNDKVRLESVNLPHEVLKLYWMYGFPASYLSQVITSAPPVLQSVARQALEALDVLFTAQRAASAAHSPVLKPRSAYPAIGWDEDVDVSSLQRCNPGSFTVGIGTQQGQRQSVSVDGAAQSLYGVHPEEALARTAAGDLPAAMHEVEMFCTILDDLCNVTEDRPVVRYVRWKRGFMRGGNEEGTLVKWTRYKQVDGPGEEVFKCAWECCTPEQFDMAMERDPHSCRPFAALMGDRRGGSEVLHKDESLDTWQGLLRSPDGPSRLHALAQAVEHRFRPMVAAAAAALAGMAAAKGGRLEILESDGP